jgi:hypothetical protein
LINICFAGLQPPAAELISSAWNTQLQCTTDSTNGSKTWPQPQNYILQLPQKIEIGSGKFLEVNTTADICTLDTKLSPSWCTSPSDTLKTLLQHASSGSGLPPQFVAINGYNKKKSGGVDNNLARFPIACEGNKGVVKKANPKLRK